MIIFALTKLHIMHRQYIRGIEFVPLQKEKVSLKNISLC